MPPYRQRVVAPPALAAARFARGAAPPLWQSAGFGSVGCPPPPCAPCAASARLGLALAAPPFSVGAWLRGGSRRGERRVPPPAGGGGKTPFLGFPRTPFLTVAENLSLYRQPQGPRFQRGPLLMPYSGIFSAAFQIPPVDRRSAPPILPCGDG